MAKAKETKYIVGEHGYLLKGGKVFKTGEEISLTDAEFKNVEKKVVKTDAQEAESLKQLAEASGFKDGEQEDDGTKENETKK